MKFQKAKKRNPGKVHKVSRTWGSAYEGFFFNERASLGFSYRGQWVHEGSPGTFEDWLVSKGVISSSGSREQH